MFRPSILTKSSILSSSTKKKTTTRCYLRRPFLSAVTRKDTLMAASSSSSTSDDAQHDPQCIFCRIARHEIKPGRQNDPQELVYETETLVAFADVAPVSDFHVLIIPKAHLRTCWNLTPDLLQEMQLVAKSLLQQEGIEQQTDDDVDKPLLFFSRPPFLSVPHVHLHVIRRPFTKFNWWNPLHYHYHLPALQVTPTQLQAHFEEQHSDG